VSDHRLMVVEPELAATFKVAARDTNTLSPVIRQAWDTGTLRTLTRNNPLTAKGAHISIVGHITAEELKRHLTSTEAANGFANRFLWLLVRRSKKLPDGGNLDPKSLAPHVHKLAAALAAARKRGAMHRDPEARTRWHDAYDELSEGEPGLAGAILARSEAQVTRLSLVYALADGADIIGRQHLEAALELWDYSARSVRHLFGNTTGDPDADQIDAALRRNGNGGLTRSDISALFGRHASSARLDRALGTLTARGAARVTREETGGRPVERWLSSHLSLTSPSQDWPAPPSDTAYHGPLGELVHLINPHTEADPVAILTQLLVAFGNSIGRTPYVSVEADRHYPNLFSVLVGETAKARKGTSWGQARRVIAGADPVWEDRIMGGLSSGEGLIAQVCEREESETSEERRGA
jgi:hypothetical protein